MLHGALKDIDLMGFLQRVGDKEGIIVIDFAGGEVRIYLRRNSITGIHLNGVPVFVARLMYHILSGINEGEFKYFSGSHDIRDVDIDLITFVFGFDAFKEEKDEKEEQINPVEIVSPDVEYVLVNHTIDANIVPEYLREFIETSRSLLLKGASSRRISEVTGLSLSMVRNYLTLMEIEGYVKPKEKEVSRLKVVITGLVGAGKTTMVKTLSTVLPVNTDERSSVDIGKPTTTIAMDLGIVELKGTLVHLFGTPGQSRFSFMWDELMKGASGYIFLVDGSDPDRLEEAARMLSTFREKYDVPFIVGVTKRDLDNSLSLKDIAMKLGVPEDIVIEVNATDRESAKRLLSVLINMLVPI